MAVSREGNALRLRRARGRWRACSIRSVAQPESMSWRFRAARDRPALQPSADDAGRGVDGVPASARCRLRRCATRRAAIDVGEQVRGRREPGWRAPRRLPVRPARSSVPSALTTRSVPPAAVGDAEARGRPARVARHGPVAEIDQRGVPSGSIALSVRPDAAATKRPCGDQVASSVVARAGAASRRAGRPRDRAATGPAAGRRRVSRSVPAAASWTPAVKTSSTQSRTAAPAGESIRAASRAAAASATASRGAAPGCRAGCRSA